MVTTNFPTDLFCREIVRFLDAIEYEDSNLSRDERVEGLRYVHSKTAAYFTQPLQRETLKKVDPARIAAVTRTASQLVVYCWPRVARHVQADISIFWSIANVLDDEINADPAAQMSTFWEDLLQGKQQKHPFWVLVQAHLPRLLGHYGSFCAFNVVRCTFDYFEGCWIEQHGFQGYPGSDAFPLFVRRLNSLGGVVGGTLFPAARFDERRLARELSCVMAHIDGPVALVNDLISAYKEFDLDEANLLSSWRAVDGITTAQALRRAADQSIQACARILRVFEDKDPEVRATICGFVHGYVTWHFCDLRYRLREVYEAASRGPDGAKFREYYDSALSVGWVDLEDWALPQKSLPLDECHLGECQVNGS